MALQQQFGIKCYFATPYHLRERGSNENLNGLIRQYLPKGMCMKPITQKDCNAIAQELNERPRKRYAFQTPQEIYSRIQAVSHLTVEFKPQWAVHQSPFKKYSILHLPSVALKPARKLVPATTGHSTYRSLRYEHLSFVTRASRCK